MIRNQFDLLDLCTTSITKI